jgi:hypothetical protein
MLPNVSLLVSEPLGGLKGPIKISLKTVKVSYTVKSLHGSSTISSTVTTMTRNSLQTINSESGVLAHVG